MKESSIWVRCPVCGDRTHVKIYKDSVLLNVPLYCPACKRETRVSVIQRQLVVIDKVQPLSQ